jgi:hypothetical protein
LLDPFEDSLIVRRSRRARHLILQVVPPHTLEIVVPYGTRPKEVEAFVREHRQWIERARVDISRRFKGERSARPAEIRLAAVNLAFPVAYEHRPSSRPSLSALSGGLRIVVPDEAYTVTAILRRWLLEQAALHLKPWLRREAVHLGLQPRRITVRLQRTRWGSCSSQGNLNLNASLLFLRPEVVRYLLIYAGSIIRAGIGRWFARRNRTIWRSMPNLLMPGPICRGGPSRRQDRRAASFESCRSQRDSLSPRHCAGIVRG